MRKILDKLLPKKEPPTDPGPNPDTIREALTRIRPILPTSPLTPSPTLSEATGRQVFFKWENKFKTGSFKERGAINLLAQLTPAERSQGVCAASAGNHALALSHHAKSFGVPCRIVMPVHAPLIKVQSTKSTGADVILHGETFDEAYQYAMQIAKEQRMTFAPPFDHPAIVSGQGTVGLELLEQVPDLDAVIVPVGGGGLASGIALAVKEKRPNCFILGVQSEWAAHHRDPAYQKPKLLLADTSLADGIAVKMPGVVTEPLLRKHLDKIVTVSENVIARSIIAFLETERVVVEGGGAVGLGALLGGHLPESYKRVVIVVSGSNIDVNLLSRLIEWDMGERDRLMRINVSVPDRPGSLSSVSAIVAQLGANVLEVHHDRSFSRTPGNVDILFLVEVRSREHKLEILEQLRARGITVDEVFGAG